ncbi:Ankyrin repeat domain-containing protein 1, partial [Tetrabaena socialis]
MAAAQDERGGSSGNRPTASPPHDFCCPITLCVMRDPVVVKSGHSFERKAITRHLAISCTNPVTNKPLKIKALTPNINLRNAIEMWLSEHGMTHEQADAAGMQVDNARPPTPPGPLRRSDLALRPARTADERALLAAASAGRLRKVERLLSNPAANPNVQGREGSTALHCASMEGHTEVVEALLRAGADMAAKDDAGFTALHWASQEGHTHVSEVLLRAGADVAAKDDGGSTALHCASMEGHTEAVEALLRAGADVAANND